MKEYHNELDKYNTVHCNICHEMWPTKGKNWNEERYICQRCQQNPIKFSNENDLIPDQSLSFEICCALHQLTMVEEVLLSPVLPIMSVFQLPSGHHVQQGFIANF